MDELSCGLAADTKVETPEGAMAVRSLVNKNASVFTREDSGRVRFRRMLNVRCVAEAQAVLRITLATGASFRVAPNQLLFKKGMTEVRADTLRPADALVPVFHYNESYEYVDDEKGAKVISDQSICIASIEPAGTADLYSFGVNQTGNFAVSAGVLCKAESA